MTDERKSLPENAYRELKPGETYTPVFPEERGVLEVTLRSVLFGLAMGVLFSAAAAYIALKLGQGIESAIPISILAIGFSALLARRSTLLENVNVLAIGATSGIVVGGSVFTMPAIFMLGLEDRTSFFQIFIVPFLGAVPRRALPDPVPPLLRGRDARQAALPGGHRHHRDPDDRRARRPAGQGPGVGDGSRLRVRLRRAHLHRLARHLHDRR